MKTPKLYIYYSTISPQKEAEKLSKTLVENKIAICVNIIPNVISFYNEKSKVLRSNESVLIIKSFFTPARFCKELKTRHIYEIPFISRIDSKSLNPDYTNWAKNNLFNS